MTKEIKIVAVFVFVAIFQIAWHWLVTCHNTVSEMVLRFYLLHNPQSRKGIAGYIDLALPAIIIGLLLGRIGWQWSIWKRAGFVLVFGAALVALTPIYVLILGADRAWWWPRTRSDLSLFFVREAAMTFLLLAVCVYGGRLWRVER